MSFELRLRRARRDLDDLYADLTQAGETRTAWCVSDAMDEVDNALTRCRESVASREEDADAR